MEIKIPFYRNIVIYFTGYAFSLTPGKLGEVIRSKYLKDEFQLPISRTAPTVLAERYYDVVGVVVITLIAYAFLGAQNVFIPLSFFLLIVFYFSVNKKFSQKIFSVLGRIKRFNKIHYKLVEIRDSLEILLKPRIFIKSSLLSIISWGLESVGVYFIFKAFALNISLLNTAFVFVVGSLIGAASFLPGGVGGTEGGLLGLLILNGYSYDEIIGPVLMIRTYTLWYVIILGIFFTIIYNKHYRN
jgi:uncharacterized protein (TIRG00374 family)